jgi:hypothetical protein
MKFIIIIYITNYNKALCKAYSKMLGWDFPMLWDGNLNEIIRNIESNNMDIIYGSLRCFYEIAIKYS